MESNVIQKLNNICIIMVLGELKGELSTMKKILIEDYLETRLNDKRYQNPGKLNKYECQALS